MIRKLALRKKSEAGFSLLEVAILLCIVSLAVATCLQSYRQYRIARRKNVNDSAFQVATEKMQLFLFVNGRLPCPADPSLPPDNANAGKEVCSPATTALGCFGTGKVCRINGARPVVNPAPTPDPLLTGALPYVTLGAAYTDVLDGWNNQLPYTVTEYMTRSTDSSGGNKHYNEFIGAIAISSKNAADGTIGNSKIGNLQVNAIPFVIFSAGQNGKGAYNYNGKLVAPCTPPGRDVENCNGDSMFLLSQSAANTNLYSLNTDAASLPFYYDDPFMIFQISGSSDKWKMASAGTGLIYTKTGGRVGIGTDTNTLTADLDVRGTVRAKNVYADKVCDASGTKCFDPQIFGGLGMNCNGGLVEGIVGGTLQCVTALAPTLYNPRTCPTGKFITGFDASNNAICSP